MLLTRFWGCTASWDDVTSESITPPAIVSLAPTSPQGGVSFCSRLLPCRVSLPNPSGFLLSQE